MVYTFKYIISVTDIYTKAGLTISDIDLTANDYELIQQGEAELEIETGRKFTNGTAITEYINGPKKDLYGYSGSKATSINLRNYPVQSITEFKMLNIDGTAQQIFGTLTAIQVSGGTFDTVDYWLDTATDSIAFANLPYGRITMKTAEFNPGINNIKVSYTYGYASVPSIIKHLAVNIIAIKAWVTFLGGNYNFINSYSIPQQSVTKGDIYDRGTKMAEFLSNEINTILDRIGRRKDTLIFATGQDR